MANSVTFDTLAYAQLLQDAGVPQDQAKAFAKAQKAALEDVFASKDVATKADIARLESKLDARLAEMENRMTKSMYNAITGFAAVIAAIVIGSISVAVLFLK